MYFHVDVSSRASSSKLTSSMPLLIYSCWVRCLPSSVTLSAGIGWRSQTDLTLGSFSPGALAFNASCTILIGHSNLFFRSKRSKTTSPSLMSLLTFFELQGWMILMSYPSLIQDELLCCCDMQIHIFRLFEYYIF